tara:strand:+ start:146 stop:694 length:549 start_codon:yes stop_codon:yes gene_type:complete
MNKKTVLTQIKTLLNIEVKLEQMKLDNGTVIEADSFEPDYEIFVISGEDKIPMPMGEYTLEDGKILTVKQDGIIGEIKDASEEAPSDAPAPADVPVEAEQAPTSPKKIVESISKELFFSEIEKLRNEINELKLSKIEEVAPVELSEVEVVEPLVHNPEKLSKQKATFYKKESLTSFLNNRKK